MIIQIHRVRARPSIQEVLVHRQALIQDRTSLLQDLEEHLREPILRTEILQERIIIRRAHQDQVHRGLVIEVRLLMRLQEILRDRREIQGSLTRLQEDWIRQEERHRTLLPDHLMHVQEARNRAAILHS